MIVTLDPGKNGCGLAWGHNFKVVGAKYVPNPDKSADPYQNALNLARALAKETLSELGFSAISRIVIEHPRIYFGSKKGNDKNDLFALVAVGAAFATLVAYPDGSAPVVSVYPADWKGQVPKEVMTKRIISKLGKDELEKVQPYSKTFDHNTWDAVGILLWDEGRL